MKKLLAITLAALWTSACQTQMVDNSPKVMGAVINAQYSVNGQVLPDFTGKQKVYTVSDKRAIRDEIKFDSILMRWANIDEADVARLDQNKFYKINYKGEKYSECPISGCTEESFMEQFKPKDGDNEAEDDYQDYEELGCVAELTKNDFDVKKTGQTRKLNGFDVEQYTVLWTTEFADTRGKKDLNLISFDFWNTTPDAAINEVWAVHGQFQDAISKKAPNDPLINLLGEKGYKALAAFTGDTNNQENQFGGAIGKQLASVKGYPISIKFEWVRKSEACQQEKEALAESLNLNDGIEGVGKQLLGSLAKKGSDKLLENWKKQPLIRYVYEIKSVSMDSISESNFNVPAGFKLVDRK